MKVHSIDGMVRVQGLESVAEHLWRHRDKYAAQLADRLTLRKIIDTDDDALELVVAIRYVSHLHAIPFAVPFHCATLHCAHTRTHCWVWVIPLGNQPNTLCWLPAVMSWAQAIFKGHA